MYAHVNLQYPGNGIQSLQVAPNTYDNGASQPITIAIIISTPKIEAVQRRPTPMTP